jgi:hypothetical protein
MGIKVKELKDDLLIDVKVNKSYYLMLKTSLHFLFNLIKDDEKRAIAMKNVMKGKYEEMDPYERTFYTLTLILAEIERVSKEGNHYEEKEVLEPNDEGYIPPTNQE